MATLILDTLEYATKLKAAGFNEQQSEGQARALAEILDKQMATKAEVTEHENALRRDIEALRLEVKRDIEVLRLEVKRDLAETKADLTRWVIGAGFLQTTIVVGVLLKVAKLI